MAQSSSYLYAQHRNQTQISLVLICVMSVFVGCAKNTHIVWNEDGYKCRNKAHIASELKPTMSVNRINQKPAQLPHTISFQDPIPICRYIWNNLRNEVIVYPSERYYYYKLYRGRDKIYGNFRFSSVENGTLYFACYNGEDRSQIGIVTLDEETPDFSIKQIAPSTYRGTWLGKSVTFVLYQPPLLRDNTLRNAARKTYLFDVDEQIVTGLLDESGVAFILLYNNVTNAFYYCLDELLLCTPTLAPTQYDYLWLDPKSQFVFLEQKHDNRQRYLLVGVNAENIMNNNYYDGPFDQVPPDLDLKDMLMASYPYVQYRGGIDSHGNFLALDAQRVAISPYMPYDTLGQLAKHVHDILQKAESPSQVASVVTYEPKRDYHRKILARPAPDSISVMGFIEHILKPNVSDISQP